MINLYYPIENSYFPINNFSLFKMDTRNGRRNKAKYDIQTETIIANNFVCYRLKHPQITLNKGQTGWSYTIYLYLDLYLYGATFNLFIMPYNDYPHQSSNNLLKLLRGRLYDVTYIWTVSYLMSA